MQPQPIENKEVSSLSAKVVGACGTNAVQRAAKAFELALEAQNDDNKSESGDSKAGHLGVGVPVARLPETQVNSKKTSAKSGLKASGKPLLIGLAAAITLALSGWYGYHWLTAGRFIVSTDDAYVRADATTLAAKVSGYVSAIDVADNSYVHTGDVIARIDDGDYRLAVETARDKLATQQSTVARIGKQIEAQQASVDQAKAQLASAQAVETRTQSELKRQQELAAREFASKQTLEQAQSNRDQAVAAVKSAQAALDAAVANVGVLTAQRQEATRQQQELQTALAKAERDLSFTIVHAPVDGMIGNRAMRVGDFVQTGQRLASIVPLAEVYIDANFKETQLARLKPGQPASISVDALPDREISGTVASVSPASGSVFSLLPPDNATGNFTKIVQRLTVRIQLPTAVTDRRLLRPGMSVVVGVNTKPQSQVPSNGGWSKPASTPHWQAAQW